MKKEDKITVIEMQKFFNKHNTGLRLGKREFDAINEIIAVSQFPVQEQSKQEVKECPFKKQCEGDSGFKEQFCGCYNDPSLPQEQKDKVTGVGDEEIENAINQLSEYAFSINSETLGLPTGYKEHMNQMVQIVRSLLSSKAVEQIEPDGWVEYDFRKLHTRPNKYGKYFVCRKDGKTHWETWNGSGWAYNENSIKYWKEILPPNKSSNHGLNKEPNGWVSDGCFYPNDGTHIANELATPVYFHPPIKEAEHKQGVTDEKIKTILVKFLLGNGEYRSDQVIKDLRSLFGEKGKEAKGE